MTTSVSPSGEVPGAAVRPGPVTFFKLVCSSHPNISIFLLIQQSDGYAYLNATDLHAWPGSHGFLEL